MYGLQVSYALNDNLFMQSKQYRQQIILKISAYAAEIQLGNGLSTLLGSLPSAGSHLAGNSGSANPVMTDDDSTVSVFLDVRCYCSFFFLVLSIGNTMSPLLCK